MSKRSRRKRKKRKRNKKKTNGKEWRRRRSQKIKKILEEREISLCLYTGENYKLFHHSAYFCYYSWTHYTFWHYSWVSLYYFSYILPLSTVLSIISFQFQQNKRYLNRPKYYLREEEREWNKKINFFF